MPAPSRGCAAAPRLRGFAPIAAPDARVLVLGSMPGVASLRAGEYYAHPQNAFWRIMGTLLDFEPGMAYAGWVAALAAGRIAVWDVLAACDRPGSLDSDIDPGSAKPNRFGEFFLAHPELRRVCFNGGTAAQLYRRHVSPVLGPQPEIRFLRLPSTSPAHARLSLEAKLEAWRGVLP
ncbi:MAG: DNA-deoxyinosine glycosylase [Steroidobacteraceae bacterium]|nr:DNA-deoxyinosine glycosylase [Steroidobacteraceae bacterium]